jgi:hypothetical protein
MFTNLKGINMNSSKSNQEKSVDFESDHVESELCPPSLELGSPLVGNHAVGSSNELGAMQGDSTPETATVVVRFMHDGRTTCYVANLFFYPEHANAYRDGVVRDLSLQIDAGCLRRVVNDPSAARNFLLQNVAEHLQIGDKAFRDQILRFARATLALLGFGNYVFDMTVETPTVATMDRLELLISLMTVPVEGVTYFGVVTPSLARDIALHASSNVVAVRRPQCRFTPQDGVTNDELFAVALELRSALKSVLEREICRLFIESYGEVRVFFNPISCDTPDLIEYLKNIVVVLYPAWQEEHIDASELVWKGTGAKIFELSGGYGHSSSCTAAMDLGLTSVVDDASQFCEMAFDFLEDDYSRWSQKLDPDRAADATLTAEELMSAMRFLRRRMRALAAHLVRE